MTESIDDSLSRLAKEFDKMLGKPIQDTESRADILARFGFTPTEAEAWLKQEPDFDKPIVKRDVTKSYQNPETLQFIVPSSGQI